MASPEGLPSDAALDAGTSTDAGSPWVSFGTFEVRIRPTGIRPGDLFEISVRGERLRSAAASLGGRSISMFATGPSSFRAYAAAPLDLPTGPAVVHVGAADERSSVQGGSVAIQLEPRTVGQKTVRVDSRFTSPSAAQKAQMRADGRAIAASYEVPYEPPGFRTSFAAPLPGEHLSRFGERRVFNGKLQSRHWGLDIDGKQGEPVRAANDGIVTLARACFTSGNTVIVSHGAALFTSYFHLSSLAVSAGQAVKKGEVVGYVGSTGRSTGPHLHFAAKLGGVSIDPEALLAFDFALSASDAADGDDRGSRSQIEPEDAETASPDAR